MTYLIFSSRSKVGLTSFSIACRYDNWHLHLFNTYALITKCSLVSILIYMSAYSGFVFKGRKMHDAAKIVSFPVSHYTAADGFIDSCGTGTST